MNKRPALGRNPAYWNLLAGQFVSSLGATFGFLVLTWLSYDLTSSPLAVGQVVVAFSGAAVATRLIAGSVVDRVSAKHVMVAADAITGATYLALMALAASGGLDLALLCGLAAVAGAAAAFFEVSAVALLPALVRADELQRANSLGQSALRLPGLLGYGLGGLAVATLGPSGAALMVSCAFALSAALESLIPYRRPDLGDPKGSPLAHALAGVAVFKTAPALFWLATLAGVYNLAWGAVLALGLPLLAGELEAGPGEYGLAGAASAAAFVLGALVLAVRRQVRDRRALMAGALLWGGAAVMTLSFASSPAGVVAAIFAAGLAGPGFNIPAAEVFQRLVPAELRGRVFALIGVLAQVSLPLGSFLGGALGEVDGPRVVILGAGAVVVAVSAIALMAPALAAVNGDLAEVRVGGGAARPGREPDRAGA